MKYIKFNMTSCILTIIKNEHEYLDEWIKYHLNIGIDKIFIFEDLDSESHEYICNKYDNVSLMQTSCFFNENDRKKIIKLKLLRKYNPQETYIKKFIKYIQNNYQYDWCFVIDIDEFITFENDNINLQYVLNLYKDYDAFVMQWKIYGANGLINKPDYTNKGVIDIYTEPSEYIGHSVIQWTTKTCYNLNTFKEPYFKENHQPQDICKWCRTDFSNIRDKIVYNIIYIRHYITRSWEEYIAKRKRGYFMGYARTTDMFFKVNPDMCYLKDKLTNELKREILVVLPYKQSASQGNELRLSLNGWRRFCVFKFHLIVIGQFDESLKDEFPWVEFIQTVPFKIKEHQYNPHIDIQNKFNVVAKMYSQIYDGFIYTCDDYYPIKPFDLEDIMITHYQELSFIGAKDRPTYFWAHDKWKTRQLLDREHLPHINYTTHYPYYMEFKKLKEICNKFNMLEESYVFDDVYFNYFEHNELILADEIRFGVWSKKVYDEGFQNAINNPNIKFICNGVNGWCEELKQSLEDIILR